MGTRKTEYTLRNLSLRRVQPYYDYVKLVYINRIAQLVLLVFRPFETGLLKQRVVIGLNYPPKSASSFGGFVLRDRLDKKFHSVKWTITITRDHQFLRAVGIILLRPFY